MRPFSVTVFCASSPPKAREEEYLALAYDFGWWLAGAGMRCVNGGGTGMMAALSQGGREAGGEVHRVALEQYPPEDDFHSSYELHPLLSPRQHALMLAGDAYVALPGGYGSVFEILDVLNRKVLLEIPMERPLICVGSEEYGELKRLLAGVHARGFARHDPHAFMKFVADKEAAMELLIAARAALG